jgi:dephospho-CoA kinase
MAPTFDATITVVAADRHRMERAAARGHGSLEGRDGRQLTQEEKAAKATHVVENHGSVADLEEELERLYPALVAAR